MMSDSRVKAPSTGAEVVALFARQNLRIGRELRGWSQVELAQRSSTVTAASISQFENGHSRPSAATLDGLASTLRVPVAFFTARLTAADEPQVTGFFRSLRSTTPRQRRQALALVGLVRALVAELEEVTALPVLTLPRHPVDDEAKDDVIECIAQNVRDEWGLCPGPVSDVVRCIERRGIVTTRAHTSLDGVDAFSVPTPTRRPVIVLGADKGLRDRSRFDAAHELGHLVMHNPADEGSRAAELQAHQFASAFLMPAEDIYDQLPSKADWPRLLELKRVWQVSIAALLKRAQTLEVMTPATYMQAYKFMSVRGWRKNEPGRLGSPESPVLLQTAVNVAAAAGEPLSELIARAGLPYDEVMALLRVDHHIPHVEI